MSVMGGGEASSSALRFSRTRGRIGGGGDSSIQYPSPFFDIGQTYLPATVKQMFRWCRYYFLVNPLINTVAAKMAEYPVTDIILDTDRLEHKDRWESFLSEQLRYRAFQIEVGLDYYVYGNALVSIFYPFVKILICRNCNFEKAVADSEYRFMNFEFHWNCPKCGEMSACKVRDHYVKAPKGIRLIRWNPEDVDIRYNDINGEYEYYYTIPVQLRNDIIIGKKSAVEAVPQLFIDALRLKKSVVFSRDNIFHFKRPTLAGKDRGWGIPMILPVLKDTFYLQILRKAQEAIAMEHIVPLRVLFPQAGSASSDPYSSVNLADWRDQVASEIRQWRCVSPESLIDTSEGLRPAGDITVGDWLKNRNGIYERVVKRHERSMDVGERAYRLKVRGQHAVDTVYSEEHPIWAARKVNNGNGHKLGEAKFIPVSELAAGDYVGYPTYREVKKVEQLDLATYTDRAVTEGWVYVDHQADSDVPHVFEYLEAGGSEKREDVLARTGWGLSAYVTAQNAIREGRVLRRLPRYQEFDEELAWVLGMYAAEGNTNPKGVYFSLHVEETAFVDRLDAFFVERFGAKQNTSQKSESGIQVVYHSTIAAQFFHTLMPGTAIDKRLPNIVRQAPDNLAAAAVRGLLDGDGSYYTEKTVLGVASRQLAEDVRQLLLSWQILPGLSYEKGKPVTICGKETHGSGCYHLQVSGDAHAKLTAVLNAEIYEGSELNRIGLFRDGFAWFRIEEVAQVEAATVIAFQMEGDSTFCTWGVATHNSDNNYIPIMSLPIGQQTIGGDGRALLLSQEIRVWSEHIVAGMGVPVELIFGGLSYSGSNVSMRMLENMHLGYLTDHRSLLKWIIEHISSYLGWAPVRARFKPFKMADDLQRKAYLFQLSQAGKVSDETLLADADMDSAKEDKIMEIESARRANATKKQKLLQAEIEGEAAMVTMRWQNKAQLKATTEQLAVQNEMAKDQGAFQATVQKDLMQNQMAMQTGQSAPPNPELASAPRNPAVLDMPKEVKSPLTLSSVQPAADTGQTMDVNSVARRIADRVAQLPLGQRPDILSKLQAHSPELHDAVLGLMASGSNGPSTASAASARPLPQQRAPRRGPEAGLI